MDAAAETILLYHHAGLLTGHSSAVITMDEIIGIMVSSLIFTNKTFSLCNHTFFS